MRIVRIAKQFVPFPVILRPTNIHTEVNVEQMHVWQHHNAPGMCLYERQSNRGISNSEAMYVVPEGFETVQKGPGITVTQYTDPGLCTTSHIPGS